MKIKDLLKEINRCKKLYGKDFLDFEVYAEQITSADRKYKTKGGQKNWGKIKDLEGWEYFECAGFNTVFENKKIFTVNVNY